MCKPPWSLFKWTQSTGSVRAAVRTHTHTLAHIRAQPYPYVCVCVCTNHGFAGAADFPSELGVRMHLKNTASCVNQSHLQRTRALKRRLSRRGLDAEAPEHKAPRLAIPALVPPAPDAEADRRVALAQLVEALAAHALGSKGEHLCDTLTLPLCPPLLEYNVPPPCPAVITIMMRIRW